MSDGVYKMAVAGGDATHKKAPVGDKKSSAAGSSEASAASQVILRLNKGFSLFGILSLAAGVV